MISLRNKRLVFPIPHHPLKLLPCFFIMHFVHQHLRRGECQDPGRVQHPFMPNRHSACGDVRPAVAGGAGGKTGRPQRAGVCIACHPSGWFAQVTQKSVHFVHTEYCLPSAWALNSPLVSSKVPYCTCLPSEGGVSPKKNQKAFPEPVQFVY